MNVQKKNPEGKPARLQLVRDELKAGGQGAAFFCGIWKTESSCYLSAMGYAESFPSFSYSVDDIKEQRWVQPVFCKKSKALYTLSSIEVMPLSRTELNNGAKKFKNKIKYNSVVTNWNCDMGQQTGSLCACIKYVCNTYHFQSFGPLGILHFKLF